MAFWPGVADDGQVIARVAGADLRNGDGQSGHVAVDDGHGASDTVVVSDATSREALEADGRTGREAEARKVRGDRVGTWVEGAPSWHRCP